MNIQSIFDKVIAAKHYDSYMCFALDAGARLGVITKEEKQFAKDAIKTYLGTFNTLWMALSYNNLPDSQADCEAIYKDWSNRPRLNYTIGV